MKIRKYQSTDCPALAMLFYDTVHIINAKDYSRAQLDVWATGHIDISAWDKSYLKNNTLVAEENGIIFGFGDMNDNGYLDHLYVHKDHQGKGIESLILNMLERESDNRNINNFSTHASITSKPFFEKHGYEVLCSNTVIRDGIELINLIMRKDYVKVV
jgi:putative acetyltransferase